MAGNTPHPGSDEALDNGCTCPVMDNHHGDGIPMGELVVWVIDPTCPLHGIDTVEEEIDG